MAEPRPVYRPLPLPALGDVAEEQVTREFRRLSDWSLSVDRRLDERPPWGGAGCPADQGRIPYYDCADGAFKPSVLYYDPSPPSQPAYPAILSDADFIFTYDAAIAFLADGNAEPIGGIGHISQAPGWLILAGTVDIDQWENLATRRPLAIGGSEVVIDAGNSLDLRLPGVVAYEHGYDLQLSNDGESVLAVPNPPPDFQVGDASQSDGDLLLSGAGAVGWTTFPYSGAGQPDKLEVVIPSGTQAGLLLINVRVRVDNTSARTGTITLGVGLDGANPEVDNSRVYPIPALFQGSLDLTLDHLLSADLTADLTLTVMYLGQGDHNLFSLETDTTDGDHNLDARITYGGGGGSPGVTDHQLLTNRDPAGGGAHLAASISYDNTGSGLAATQVQAAIDELAGGESGEGGWTKVGDSTVLSAVGSTFVDIAFTAYSPLTANRNVSITSTDGRIVIVYYPKKKIILHLSLAFRSSVAGQGFRVSFRNNLTAAGTAFGGAAEVEAGNAGDLVQIHHSAPCKVEDAFAWYAAIRTTGGGTADVTLVAGTFWLEYE